MFSFELSPSNKHKWETCNSFFFSFFMINNWYGVVHSYKIYLFCCWLKKPERIVRKAGRQDRNLSRLSCSTCCKPKKNWNGFAFTTKSSSPVFSLTSFWIGYMSGNPAFFGRFQSIWPNQRTVFWYRFWLINIIF